ncbi:hypothetical protein N7491_005352 [Penicillium cf. griseofulvum]|uniref:Mid2 domain-containing protein n=1 Tax=Penicillium cf. griseofulvum TaxID=2972120 RepID=A0A9W9J1T7_9EURO|nr:hypothetical protein N7472_008042 [Penicillium cf. griseofulvum]KAJ5434757.1 hypothetical protein N7491_005352 [Penicillium cf. griseofulvum]KAJ5452588.1 hypothetical protein N7445_000771 [Penicillium cf. griseofulvum]
MRSSILALCTVLCSRVLGHPYTSEITWNPATTSVENSWPVSEPSEVAQLNRKRGYGEILQARDTTTTAESTASTTDTTTSETAETASETTTSEATTSATTSEATSEATTSTTESTASPTSETTTETTSTSTTPASTSSTTSSSSVTASSTSVTTITSTSTSSPSTTATDTTTTTPTSMTAAELAEWNHRGNIAAIAFGSCFISIFIGVAIVYYACGKAKARRIAASKLSNSSQSYSKIPLAAIQEAPSTDLEADRSHTAYTNNPQTHYSPAGNTPSVSHYSDTHSAVSAITADRSSARGHTSRTHQ